MESNLPGDLGPALHDQRHGRVFSTSSRSSLSRSVVISLSVSWAEWRRKASSGASSGSLESVLVPVLLENPLLRHLLKKRRDCLAQLLAIVREIFHQKIYEVV